MSLLDAFVDELILLAQENQTLDAQVTGKPPGVKRPLVRRTSKEEMNDTEKEEQRSSAA